VIGEKKSIEEQGKSCKLPGRHCLSRKKKTGRENSRYVDREV
jgi:hypothetical protein